jgi:precorrin-3B synthase
MIRGWCPSVYEPMATGDGLLVRVKPRGGVISSAGMRVVAERAVRFGNGTIELTSRGNLQVRGLSPEGAASFARAMVAAGLASADPAAERRRNVIATPLAGVDPAVHPATGPITEALERGLEADASLAELPAKFGFLVDGGGVLPPAVRADVRLRLLAKGAEVAFGADVLQVALEDAVSTALSLSLRERAGMRVFPGGRGRIGAVGAIGAIAVGAGLPFGSAGADIWLGLADLAERYGDGKLRLTPWRAVLVVGVAAAALADLGLITDPDDPRLRVAACPGEPGCGSASVATRRIAAQLRPAAGATIHVSGCEKGCAHPGAASLTFVGRDGRFDLVQDGSAGDAPVLRGLSAAEVLAR